MPIPLPSHATAWRLVLLAVAASLALLQGLSAFAPDTFAPYAFAPGAMPLPGLPGGGRAAPVPPLRAPSGAEPPERWAAILERPIFHPDRRPWAAAMPEPTAAPAGNPAPPAPIPATLPAWTLLGTTTDGAKHAALVRSPALPHPVILRRGDALEGWSVQAIGRGRVMLERDGLRFELALPGSPMGSH